MKIYCVITEPNDLYFINLDNASEALKKAQETDSKAQLQEIDTED